jgi:phage shock protein E
MKLRNSIENNEGTIIDVRTPSEFQGGHAEHSINIPLHEISRRIDELQKLKTPLILCCASGGRSAQATYILSQHKIECLDAGSWINVHSLQA